MAEERRSVKLAEKLYKPLKALSLKEGPDIGFYLDRLVRNYLRRRKILTHK